MFAFVSLLVIVLIFVTVLNLPVFGALPRGSRLLKIKKMGNYRNGQIENLSYTPMQPDGVSMFSIFKAFFFEKHPNRTPRKQLPVVIPDLESKPDGATPEIIWFGHSSYLIKINSLKILVDPIFSKTPSPFSFIGSKAFPGTDLVKAEDFKDIDVMLITHDHYDHMDYQSILKLAPHTKNIITSIGVGCHLQRWKVPWGKIIELQWNETVQLQDGLSFTAVPARHFTGRKFKRNQTLWSAFVLQSQTYKLFLGGDSGYDTHFKQIGAQYGPFDIALLECGQYNAYWPYIHMFPEETVRAAIDLNTKVLMPVHWGKFSLAMHPWNEPAIRVRNAASANGVKLAMPKLGETVKIDQNFTVNEWWLD